MYRNSASLEDVFRLALPAGTEILNPPASLQRPVSWACSLRPSPPAFPKLEGGELALVDMEDLRLLDPRMRLDRVVQRLKRARIAAVAVMGEVNEDAVQVAVENEIPLFQLPANTALTRVERAIIRLIVDRSGYITQRAADLQRELNQISLDGGGLQGIAGQIFRFTQQPFLIIRDDGQLAAYAGPYSQQGKEFGQIYSSLPNITALRSWAASQPPHTLSEAVGVLNLSYSSARGEFRHVVVGPVVAGDGLRGYCLLLRPGGLESDQAGVVEELAVTQGAAAAALEWVKLNAVGIAEDRMRAAFLDELLATEIADEQAWVQRGSSLGYDLNRPHVAWMIEARGVVDWPQPLLRFLVDQDVNAPYSQRDEGILLFWPTDDPKSGRDLKVVATDFVTRVQANRPQARLVVGIGRPAESPARWLQSQQQARESWRLGKEWEAAPVTYFGDLGLYQLLTALRTNPEAARFFRKTLGPLVAHDDNRNAELVDTLDSFFECHGNLSQTAARLHIHRNTLTYRLERIASITRMNLNDPDARFALQLALKLRPVLK